MKTGLTRREFVGGVAATGAAQTPSRPNIVFFLSDDHGYWDSSVYGSRVVRTPSMEKLASDGMVFRNVLPALFTHDALVRDIAAFLLVFVSIMQPINGIVFVLDGLLIGAGDVRFLAWAMAAAAAVFIPCALLVLTYNGGIGWLWASLLLLMLIRGVTLGIRWLSNTWAVPGAALAR